MKMRGWKLRKIIVQGFNRVSERGSAPFKVGEGGLGGCWVVRGGEGLESSNTLVCLERGGSCQNKLS